MIGPSTFRLIIEAIIAEAPGKDHKKVLANEAAIYYNMAMICEQNGINAAMGYFFGTHNEEEYEKFIDDSQEAEE